MASSKQRDDRSNGIYKAKLYNPKTDYKEFKPKVYEQPPYKDPLREQPREYKGNFKIPEYKPYEPKPFDIEYKEYKGPTTDPITGKLYKKGRRKKDILDDQEEQMVEEDRKPTPKIYIPYTFGDATGSTKRTFRIYDGHSI